MDDQDKDYLIAVRHVGELSLHVRKLESELAELRRAEKPPVDAGRENEQLWIALATHACGCTSDAEKQVEVFTSASGHRYNCTYRRLRDEIMGDHVQI